MPRHSLPSSLQMELAAMGTVDVVVGIPSFNHVHTLPRVVQAVQSGLTKHFPGLRSAVIISDGGSTDGSQDAVLTAVPEGFRTLVAPHPVHPVHRIVTPYHGIPGKGSALRTVFHATALLQAKACVIVNADLLSIDPAWMDLFLTPVLRDGFDFVAPLYLRHKYDGTITNSIIYPLTRSLYGLRIRQPIGGDVGCSGRMAHHFLEQDVWDSDVARFGIDAWMTTTAIADQFKVCQAFLGAKVNDTRAPALDLPQMLRQVVGSVFSLMESREGAWKGVRGSRPVPLFGQERPVGLEPMFVDPDRMVRIFRNGLQDLKTVWGVILRPDVAVALAALSDGSPGAFRFPPDLWIRAIHDFAAAFHHRTIDRDHLIQALTPLYLGRVASFVRETEDASADHVEVVHEQLCLRFEALKPELIQRWNAHGRTP